MKQRHLVTGGFFLLLFLASQALMHTGCANIIPPSGGPKDTLPPVLLKSFPDDSTKGFKEKRIEFEFDEYIDVSNVQENLLVSPLPQANPVVEFKLKTMTVRLKDTLEPNTTYLLDFGNALKDYTEGNIKKGFTYTFTTGHYIDSLQLKGNVILAETGKVDSTLLAILHTSPEDSALVNKKPRYVAKLDGNGNFTFKNLPPGTFYLYALKNDNGMYRYLDSRQLFAFADSAIEVNGQNQPVTLYAYNEPDPEEAAKKSGAVPGRGTGKEGLDVARLRYKTTLTAGRQDILSGFTMTFETPLKTFDSTKIQLFSDSTFTPVPHSTFVLDSTATKIALQTSWIEGTQYHIIKDKDFAEDSLGNKLLKTDTLTFITKTKADYGSVRLRFSNLGLSQNPVLLIFSGRDLYQSHPLSGNEFRVELFVPGDYELRILYDTNKNGVWDPGAFFGQRRQPEMVKPIEKKINVKPAWQNEFDIAL